VQNTPLQIFKTPTAEKKIKEIIIFSAQKWGKESAKKYALELEKSIISVRKNQN
jgi:plasmid stabilization system protein ParE